MCWLHSMEIISYSMLFIDSPSSLAECTVLYDGSVVSMYTVQSSTLGNYSKLRGIAVCKTTGDLYISKASGEVLASCNEQEKELWHAAIIVVLRFGCSIFIMHYNFCCLSVFSSLCIFMLIHVCDLTCIIFITISLRLLNDICLIIYDSLKIVLHSWCTPRTLYTNTCTIDRNNTALTQRMWFVIKLSARLTFVVAVIYNVAEVFWAGLGSDSQIREEPYLEMATASHSEQGS